MSAVGTLLRWLGKKGLLYVALVAAILLYLSLGPSFDSLRSLRENTAGLSAGGERLRRSFTASIEKSNATVGGLQNESRQALDARIAAARKQRDALTCSNDIGALWNGLQGVIENRQQCLRIALLTREIDSSIALRESLDARRPRETVRAAYARHSEVMNANRDVPGKLAAIANDWVPDELQRDAIQVQRERLSRYLDARKQRDKLIETQNRLLTAKLSAEAGAAQVVDGYRKFVAGRAGFLATLKNAMKWAAIALLAIIASPFLIRLFCYFVLAPAAMRRPTIRLSIPGGADTAIPVSERSAPSVGVRLAAGEELLVRQTYLQTTSDTGDKSFRAVLNWRYLITSLATGLISLTRIRGDGQTTTVSATRDPFAEVTVLTLPQGSSCSLQPRALAAVAQPIDRPLRITTQWRLGSLNAWLTLQLRYVIFHGPARLVIKGTRGVRVEPAEKGRVFGQDQLIGFSADLAYAVTRTETLPPYLLGYEPLFKDRVEAGEGVLIIEEAPLSSARSGNPRGGIEGLLDAGLKAFGL